jgi:UDPglucose 6-dehydrogenase
MSKKYLSPGMADGGGCHPRDQIAMSFLAQSLSLSVDPFTWLANARDSQTKRQAEIIKQYAQENPTLKVVILGEAYKADINLTIGSPSRLLQHYLRELELQFTVFDPYVYPARCLEETPSLFFVATNHRSFYDLKYPKDSILLDPWGNTIDSMIQDSTVKIVLLGRQKESNH